MFPFFINSKETVELAQRYSSPDEVFLYQQAIKLIGTDLRIPDMSCYLALLLI